ATDQGKKLKRATPKCETPQYEGDYTLEDIDTGGAYDVVAIDEADNLYIADKEKATIRKHGPGATASQEFVVPGHFGDLRALTVAGDKLYIANGVDGVLKVVAATGECFGSKLFSWKDEPDQPQYFVRTANDNYYIAFGNRILQFDQKRDKPLIWQGHEAGGVGLDKNGSLVFLGSEAGYAANYIYWRQNNKSEFKQWLFSSGPGSLSVRGNDVCFTNGRSLFCATLKPESNKIDIDAIPTATSLERWDGVVRNKSGTLYVDSPNNKVYGARSVLITVPIIEGLDHPRAIAVDENEAIYVTNEGSKPHIRKYGYNYGNTKHLSDLVMKDSMKDFRDLFVDDDGSAVVLQADGVWKYSNIFAW
ncbi:MAG TPA: hypothetical protein VIT23_08060, partial [Terrimicrobiaceae bacterium]